jgi:hypothetical protein
MEINHLHALAALPTRKKNLGSHWIEILMDPSACKDALERKNILPLPEIKDRFLDRLSRGQSLYRLSNPGSTYERSVICIQPSQLFLLAPVMKHRLQFNCLV